MSGHHINHLHDIAWRDLNSEEDQRRVEPPRYVITKPLPYMVTWYTDAWITAYHIPCTFDGINDFQGSGSVQKHHTAVIIVKAQQQ